MPPPPFGTTTADDQLTTTLLMWTAQQSGPFGAFAYQLLNSSVVRARVGRAGGRTIAGAGSALAAGVTPPEGLLLGRLEEEGPAANSAQLGLGWSTSI